MEIKEKIRSFIVEELCRDRTINDLADDDPLIEGGMIDSIGIVSLLAFLEKNFGILLEEEELKVENFTTLQRVCDLVFEKSDKAEKLGKNAPGYVIRSDLDTRKTS